MVNTDDEGQEATSEWRESVESILQAVILTSFLTASRNERI